MFEIKENFLKPNNEYSPMPFWFWNDKLENEKIINQIHEMHEKGVMGFVIHPRIGIPKKIKYLSDKFIGFVKCAVQEAAKLGMKVILYDEAMYPSGSAHGMVVKRNPDFASRGLKVIESETGKPPTLEECEEIICALTVLKISDRQIDPSSVEILEKVPISKDRTALFFVEGYTNGHIRGIHFGEDDWERDPPKSADLLNPKAVQAFISLTHERYFSVLSEYFGNTIIGIFTDEPSIMGRVGNRNMKPWTAGFLHNFINSGNEITDLPALWYNMGERTGKIIKNYSNALNRLLIQSYYKPIYNWCGKHEISIMGHPAEPDDISLLKYFHIPGQDFIFRYVSPEEEKALMGRQSTQAKCSSDSARHLGLRRNLNECFACCGKNGVEWSFNADDMKWIMDWLFIRGVNMLVPHAFYYSVRGKRRYGERPPDVGPNNIWWKHYNIISDYIKRMSYMMTDSINTAKTAVLCENGYLPYTITRHLYQNQIEFNYLDIDLLSRCSISDESICIGNQKYNSLVVESASLLCDAVYEFAKYGGKVIVYNPEDSVLGKEFISINKPESVINHLEKELVILPFNKDLRMSHIIKDNIHFYVFVNEGESEIKGRIILYSSENIEVWDAWTGSFVPYEAGKLALCRRESLILCIGENPHIKTEIVLGTKPKQLKSQIELNQWFVRGKSVKLISWTEWDGMKKYCGQIKYMTSFRIISTNIKQAVLNLGQVRELAEVYVNGRAVGVRLWEPYVLDITDYIKPGKNILDVRITNSMANKYTKQVICSGLLGKPYISIY